MNAETRDYLEDVVAKKRAIRISADPARAEIPWQGTERARWAQGSSEQGIEEFIKLINSAMDNARQRFDDIDAEDMVITHVAAHRGQVATNMRPRAGRTLQAALPKTKSSWSTSTMRTTDGRRRVLR